jgi:predicted Zn-dependent protease
MYRTMKFTICTLLLCGLSLPGLAGCSRVPETGRRRVMLISREQEQRLGAEAYSEILANEKLSTDARMNAILQRVGRRIAAVSNEPEFQWEFRLIESDQINAFCLPGGKIAVYTGILPFMQNEAGMAVVMGHEVAHATLRHGAERVSQHMSMQIVNELISTGVRNASPQNHTAIMQAFGAGAAVGYVLPYSRKHESEADQIGLMYAARAGYDPQEAVAFWQRMDAHAAGSKRPPEILSTHPNPQRRISQLVEHMPEALKAYRAAPQQFGRGEQWPMRKAERPVDPSLAMSDDPA